MLVVSWFLCGILYAVLYCYLFSNLVCQEKFKINKDILFGATIFSIFYVLIKYIDSGFMQTYFTQLLSFVVLKCIYKKTSVKTLIGILSLFTISCLSELIFAIILTVFKINAIEITSNFVGYILSNSVILFIYICVSKIKYIRKLIIYIVSWYNDKESNSLIIFVFMAITILTFLMYNNYISLLPSSFLFLTNLFCICVFVFVIGFFKVKSNNNRIVTEYDNLLNYVKVYEDEIEEKSKNQHEYKNQLIVIKSMLGTRNKKIIKYIDDQLENGKDFEDKRWLSKLKYVPQGGLKGLIYYKIQEMLKKDIKVFVDVSPQLEKLKNNKNISKNLEDISKIIGVYLDNAIQAVSEMNEKYIIIEFYLEDKNVVFSLSNNYSGIVDISKLDKEGYTTKGNGHGYGLSLVKDIISKNDRLSQKRELNGIYYVQKLYIKK